MDGSEGDSHELLAHLWPKRNNQPLPVQSLEDHLEWDRPDLLCPRALLVDRVPHDLELDLDVIVGHTALEAGERLARLLGVVLLHEPPGGFGENEVDDGEAADHAPLGVDGEAEVEWVGDVETLEGYGGHELAGNVPAAESAMWRRSRVREEREASGGGAEERR